MIKIIISFFLVLNVFADDLVDLYRVHGLSAVESKIQESLETKTYWKSYLKDKNIDYGYYETKEHIILTQKEVGELSLYKKKGNDFVLVSKNNVIVGENEGDKYVEGDKKTPEGAYELTSVKTALDQFYGPLALVTSYPNTFDKTLKKKGHGIWIHGMPLDEKEEREKFTRGCIALDNSKLEELANEINLNKAVLLTSNASFKKATKNEISLILSTIYKWKNSWKKSDINRYLKFYSKDFIRFDGMKIDRFSNYKKRIFSKGEKKKIVFSNINIFPYPNSLNKRMYKIAMDQLYVSPSVNFQGKKELFLEIVNNEVQFLTEG